VELKSEERQAITSLVRSWLDHHPNGSVDPEIQIQTVEVLRSGRPALLDVMADVDGQTAHAVFGLRRPAEEAHFFRAGDEAGLGLFEDESGLGVAIDALQDSELAPMVLSAVTGEDEADIAASGVAPISDDNDGAVIGFGDRCTMRVFPWPTVGPNPGIEVLIAMDEVGFNHLAAPIALWRRTGRDLGIVQEALSGEAGGWALALTSLRDLLASGGKPEAAGGDFASEAAALGTMTGRMHLAFDRAYGREIGRVNDWVNEVERVVRQLDPALLATGGAAGAMQSLRQSDQRVMAIRTHGDFNLGRTARTDLGWVVSDWMPGGRPPRAEGVVVRSPLADVADMLWSLHHVSTVAAAERDPTGRLGLEEVAAAWEARNRRAFLSAYLATPGIGGLVPGDREVVRNLAAVFELERAAARLAP
jgi:maltokinase